MAIYVGLAIQVSFKIQLLVIIDILGVILKFGPRAQFWAPNIFFVCWSQNHKKFQGEGMIIRGLCVARTQGGGSSSPLLNK